jgi:hypothetical protein
MALYRSSLPLYEGADPRERGVGDELVVLAANVLMVAQRQAEPLCARLLLQALTFLEAGCAQHQSYSYDAHKTLLRNKMLRVLKY